MQNNYWDLSQDLSVRELLHQIEKRYFYYYLFLCRKERFRNKQIEDEEKTKETHKTICYSEYARFKRSCQADDF